MYLWNGKQGYIYEIPENQSADGKTEGSGNSQKEGLIKSLEAYKDACKPAIVSDTIFTPPSDVTFTDLSSMMKQNSGDIKKYQQQYAPTTDQSDTNPPAGQ